MCDHLVLTMCSSTVGTLVLYALSWPLRFLEISHNTYAETAGRYLMAGNIVDSPLRFIVAAIAQIVVGCALGYALLWLIRLSGTDYWFIKALGYGALAWYFGTGLLPDMARTGRPTTNDPVTHLILLLMGSIWSVVTAYLMIRYGEAALTSKKLE